MRRWWETRTAAALLVLLAAVPLLWPAVPPLTDVPGHLGRYRVMLGTDADMLDQWFRFAWRPIGYLGVDLIVAELAPLIGLEPAAKLAVLGIALLTASGILWISREVHGRVQPFAILALPLVYNFAFHYGFVNYCLAMALALNGFALWLRLGRGERYRLRAALFVPFAALVWTAHVFGWLVLGLLAACAEFTRARAAGRGWPAALGDTLVACLPLVPPALMFLGWRPDAPPPGGGDWVASLAYKPGWIAGLLRDRWRWFDVGTVIAIALLLYRAWRAPGAVRSPALVLAAAALFALFVVLPFGSAYIDARVIPYAAIVALLAIRPAPREAALLATLALALLVVRTAAGAVSFAQEARDWDRHLVALDHIPRGARVAAFVAGDCVQPWRLSRLGHLPGLAIARRAAFANDQFATGASTLLTVTAPGLAGFAGDPSQLVTRTACATPSGLRTVRQALAAVPRERFDLIWLIAPPPLDRAALGELRPVWSDGRDFLYATPLPPPAARP